MKTMVYRLLLAASVLITQNFVAPSAAADDAFSEIVRRHDQTLRDSYAPVRVEPIEIDECRRGTIPRPSHRTLFCPNTGPESLVPGERVYGHLGRVMDATHLASHGLVTVYKDSLSGYQVVDRTFGGSLQYHCDEVMFLEGGQFLCARVSRGKLMATLFAPANQGRQIIWNHEFCGDRIQTRGAALVCGNSIFEVQGATIRRLATNCNPARADDAQIVCEGYLPFNLDRLHFPIPAVRATAGGEPPTAPSTAASAGR